MSLSDTLVVTGAPGWLGSRFVEALTGGFEGRPELSDAAKGAEIRCLVLPGQPADALAKSGRVRTVSGDVRDAAAAEALFAGVKPGAVVFHLAGVIHPRRSRDFDDINVRGTMNVLEAAARAGAKRAVVMSSNSECGCNPTRDGIFDESSPYHPYLGYGRSKMRMEQGVRALHASGRLATTIIRSPWFYGPGQPPRQTLFFTMIRDGKAPIVGDGENRRSMAFVDSIAQGLMLAALSPKAAGETFWIADEVPYTMNQVVDTVERLLEGEFGIPCAHKRMKLPDFASEIAYGVDRTLQALGMYNQKFHVLSEMNKTIACSIQKAKEQLGYRPLCALEEGMRRSLRYCREQGLLR